MFGATPQGFKSKTEDILIVELENRARELFGNDIDLSPHNPLGAYIRLLSFALSQNWQALENNYYNSYIDTAEGVNLDRLGQLVGIPRKPAQKEKVVLTFTGSNAIVIPLGFLVQTSSGVLYRTIESKTIESNVAYVLAESDTVGISSRVTSNQLTEIVTPQVGIDSVTNESGSFGGALVESDGDYRARILASVGFIKNSGAIDYIKTKLEEAEFIQSVYIAENNRPIEYNNMPANSLSFTILGGTNTQVAELIYKYKPAGVQTIGEITVAVATGFGDTVDIKFSRPSYLNIYVNVTVETEHGWSANNIQLIKTAIVKYIGGVDTVGSESTEYKGLGIGEDVIAWRSFSYLKDIVGIKNLNILFGTSSTTINQTGIVVPANKIAKTQTSFIEVTVL